jgi:hypothetical protein
MADLGLDGEAIDKIASMCVPYDGIEYGYTYSDLTQRVLPAILLSAFPDKEISLETISGVVKATLPTAPFNERLGRKINE